MSVIKHESELRLEQEYQQAVKEGKCTDSLAGYMHTKAKEGLHSKLSASREAIDRWSEEGAVETAGSYSEYVVGIKSAQSTIKELETEPQRLVQAKRAELYKEFDEKVKRNEFSENQRQHFVNTRIDRYIREDEEYLSVKNRLTDARNSYSRCLALKEKWESKNRDIIDAERIRTRRAELMQADPEALRALGIEPEAVSTSVAGSKADDGKGALREALRSIHPSATDAEIENMVKLV